MKYSYPQLLEILVKEKGLALATIIEATGSTPQVPGASAIFSRSGLVAGTVGGGLLEGQSEEIALRCLKDKRARLIEIRLDADPGDREGAICGGSVSVLIDPLGDETKPTFTKALQGFRKRRPGILMTVIGRLGDGMAGVSREWLPEADFSKAAFMAGGMLRQHDLGDTLASGLPMLWKHDDALVFAEPVQPLPRLIIAGAGHVGRAVARLGNLLDFEVTVIDDRPEFANKANIPEADFLIVDGIAGAVAGIPDSPENYFVIVTRGHQNDAEALRACIGRSAAYIGLIGSKNKIALMRREFLKENWAAEKDWKRVHAPIGLAIGSKTVEEIAVSIAAELVLVRARGKDKGLP